MKKLFLLFILIYSCKDTKQDVENRNVTSDVSVLNNFKKIPEYNYDSNFILGKFDYKKLLFYLVHLYLAIQYFFQRCLHE